MSTATPSIFESDAPAPASFSREASAAKEINRLHAEAQRLTDESRHSLDGALSAAWRAGKLLIAEKARIRRHAGRGAWLPWLESCFQGGVRTAQRYMQLARRMDTPASLQGLSLRQSYMRLGIPISPKSGDNPRHALPLLKLPTHVVLAAKLTRLLRTQKSATMRARTTPASRQSPELVALYEQLRALFESPKVAGCNRAQKSF